MYHGNSDMTASLPAKMQPPHGMRHLLDDSVLEEAPCHSSDDSVNAMHQGK